MTTFTKIEQEVIALNAVWDVVDDMVNYEMFTKVENAEEGRIPFRSSSQQRLFNILLVDFLSQPQKGRGNRIPFDLPEAQPNARQSDRTYLFYLRQVCDEPKLNSVADALREPVEAFADWLDAEVTIPSVWLASINTQLDIRVQRIAFLKICGNIGKHNFARLEANVRMIRRILEENGHAIDEELGYVILDEFYEWFHTDVFAYHSTSLAAFLNDIRWALFDYLTPEFSRSFTRTGEIEYKFLYPTGCAHKLARVMYWELMNRVRSRPYFPRFKAPAYLKKKF